MLADKPIARTPAQPAPKESPVGVPSWNAAEVAQRLAVYQAALPNSPAADYLTRRGLLSTTWAEYRLGYDAVREAVAMPWFRAGQLTGIRYRLLDAQPGRRLVAETGSTFRGQLFGAQALSPTFTAVMTNGFDPLTQRSLVLVEGEINAMSVWQELYAAGVDVLSFGSESVSIPDTFIATARRYRAVLVWKDKEGLARAEAARIERAGAFWSERGDDKADANDLLRDGKLFAVCVRLLGALTRPDQLEGWGYDVQDAAQALNADDGLRKAVMG